MTYAAIITAPNPELKLRPGMTANVTVETARRDDVLRVPVAALRFKPTADLLTWHSARVKKRQRPKEFCPGNQPAGDAQRQYCVAG